jgi:hypothetical protein
MKSHDFANGSCRICKVMIRLVEKKRVGKHRKLQVQYRLPGCDWQTAPIACAER